MRIPHIDSHAAVLARIRAQLEDAERAAESRSRERRLVIGSGNKVNLHFRGVVLGPSGFAAEGREWLSALQSAGLNPSLDAAQLGDQQGALSEAEQQLIQSCAARPKQSGGITIQHMLVTQFEPDPTASCNALITIFETESLPPKIADSLNRADLILLRTEWNRRSFIRGGVAPEKIVVIPPPFDADRFQPMQREVRQPGPFRWLSVFDWSLRKGYDLLLEAFAKNFAAGEAELWIKTNADSGSESRQAICDRIVTEHAGDRAPRVHLIDSRLSATELEDLYRQADGFVMASRGEGWGRPVHEAMLMQLPVVVAAATSLNTLVPDDSVGYRVRAYAEPVSVEAGIETPCFAGQTWFAVDPTELGRRMRSVYEHPDNARRRGRRARSYALDLCDRQRIAEQLANLLNAC